MLIYLSIFLIAIIYYFIQDQTPTDEKSLLVFFMFLAFFIGLGDMQGGYDRYIYCNVFDMIYDNRAAGRDLRSLYNYVNGTEFGYFFWNVIISCITANRYMFILYTTIFMYILYYISFKKYMPHCPLACMMFLGLFYYFTMTYLRQCIAVGFAWISIQYIWERKPTYFYLFATLSFLFHNSAAVIFPLYFIPIKKYSKNTVLIVLSICLVLALTPLPFAILSAFGDASGMSTRTDGYVSNEGGVRIDYIIEVAVFIFIIFKNYHLIPNDKKNLVFLNLSYVFCAILVLFARFGQGGRFGWYFFIGLIYTFTYLSVQANSFTWMKPFIMTLSFVLFFRITSAWSFNLCPYKTFLTDGRPCGESYISDFWEYDHNYDYNKFYRKPFVFFGKKQ